MKFAEAKITNTYNKYYPQNIEGSMKEYSFYIPAKPNAYGYDPTKLYVVEAPIDLLSHGALMQLSMKKQCAAVGMSEMYRSDCWLGINRVSLSGCSDIALKQRLSDDPRIKQIVFCLDNDETGQQATEKLMNKYSQQYTVSVSIPPYGKDWNDTLKAVVSAHSKQTDKTKTEE